MSGGEFKNLVKCKDYGLSRVRNGLAIFIIHTFDHCDVSQEIPA
jgi:hypothetical protein